MTRIMIFGTFDMIHEGHVALFREARALASDPVLIVSVARDVSVVAMKGRPSLCSEAQRVEQLRTHSLVDVVVLGDTEGYIPHILAARPDVIALGYDQVGKYVDTLADDLHAAGLSDVHIVRMHAYHPEIYKTSRLSGTSV